MPYEETWEEKGLVWKFFGDVTGDEILRALLKRNMDCRFRRMQYMIFDFTSMDGYDVSEGDALKAAEYDAELHGLAPGLRIAIVATRGEVFEMTKLYSKNTTETSWEVKIFPELQLAKNWLSKTSPAPKTS
jgi:hypothetical protein